MFGNYVAPLIVVKRTDFAEKLFVKLPAIEKHNIKVRLLRLIDLSP